MLLCTLEEVSGSTCMLHSLKQTFFFPLHSEANGSQAKPLRIRLLTGLWVLLMCVLVVAKVRVGVSWSQLESVGVSWSQLE